MSVAPWDCFKGFEYALKVLKILHAYITTDTLPDFLLPDLSDLPDLPEFGNQTSPYQTSPYHDFPLPDLPDFPLPDLPDLPDLLDLQVLQICNAFPAESSPSSI